MAYIEARGLRKTYGGTVALDGIDLNIDPGRIVGLIGPNGAGKTTALNAIAGLTDHRGDLRVLGREPWSDRAALACDLCFITDIAVLPRWIRVTHALDFVAGIHPRFDREKAERFLSKTTIRPAGRVRELSKGMVAQLHLAIVIAIDAKLLVLDEPTLGLDPLYRKQFYDTLLTDYLERERTVVVATHEIEEVQDVLTDVLFMDRGRIVLSRSVEEVEARYHEVLVHPHEVKAARALGPIAEREAIGHTVMLFDGADPQRLATFGSVRTPTLAGLFMAILNRQGEPVT